MLTNQSKNYSLKELMQYFKEELFIVSMSVEVLIIIGCLATIGHSSVYHWRRRMTRALIKPVTRKLEAQIQQQGQLIVDLQQQMSGTSVRALVRACVHMLLHAHHTHRVEFVHPPAAAPFPATCCRYEGAAEDAGAGHVGDPGDSHRDGVAGDDPVRPGEV